MRVFVLLNHNVSSIEVTTTKHRNKHSSVDMVTPLRVHFNRTMATPLLYIAIADTPWIIKTKPHDILFKRTEKGNTQYRREQMISCQAQNLTSRLHGVISIEFNMRGLNTQLVRTTYIQLWLLYRRHEPQSPRQLRDIMRHKTVFVF